MSETKKHEGGGALDAFLNLFSLITLGWMSIAVGIILFQIIDKFLNPNAVLSLANFSQGGLKFGIASALIVTPIFLLVVGNLHKHYKNNTLNPQSGVYRWLTYLVLLITALNIIGRLIQLVFNLLDGDYTANSILKIVVVLLIAGGIFGYYWYDLKRNNYSERSLVSIVAFSIIIVVVVASIIGSFFIIDSPAKTRMRKYDQQRADDLSNLNQTIITHFFQNGKLPEDFSDAKFARFIDPKTSELYDYNLLSDEKYELCATFSLDVSTDKGNDTYYNGFAEWYYHEDGLQCFTVDATVKSVSDVPLVPIR